MSYINEIKSLIYKNTFTKALSFMIVFTIVAAGYWAYNTYYVGSTQAAPTSSDFAFALTDPRENDVLLRGDDVDMSGGIFFSENIPEDQTIKLYATPCWVTNDVVNCADEPPVMNGIEILGGNHQPNIIWPLPVIEWEDIGDNDPDLNWDNVGTEPVDFFWRVGFNNENDAGYPSDHESYDYGYVDSHMFRIMKADQIAAYFDYPDTQTVWRYDAEESVTGNLYAGLDVPTDHWIKPIFYACSTELDDNDCVEIIKDILPFRVGVLPTYGSRRVFEIDPDMLVWPRVGYLPPYDNINKIPSPDPQAYVNSTYLKVELQLSDTADVNGTYTTQGNYITDVFSMIDTDDIGISIISPEAFDIWRYWEDVELEGSLYIGEDVTEEFWIHVSACNNDTDVCVADVINPIFIPDPSGLEVKEFENAVFDWEVLSDQYDLIAPSGNLINNATIKVDLTHENGTSEIFSTFYSGVFSIMLPIVVDFDLDSTNCNEDIGSCDVNVSVSRLPMSTEGDVVVSYTTKDTGSGSGYASENDDYTKTSADNLTFSVGDNTKTKTISIPINNDSDFEPNEQFEVYLESIEGDNAIFFEPDSPDGLPHHLITILNDDASEATFENVTFSSPQLGDTWYYDESEEISLTGSYLVDGVGSSNQMVTANFEACYVYGSAPTIFLCEDIYTTPLLVAAPTDSYGNFSISVDWETVGRNSSGDLFANDTGPDLENSVYIKVHLATASGSIGGDAEGDFNSEEFSIVNYPTLEFDQPNSYYDIDSQTTIDVRLSRTYDEDIEFNYIVNPGGDDTAINGADYTLSLDPIVMPAGDTILGIPITISPEAGDSGIFTVELTSTDLSPSEITLGETVDHIGTIRDLSDMFELRFVDDASSCTEGNSCEITVEMVNNSPYSINGSAIVLLSAIGEGDNPAESTDYDMPDTIAFSNLPSPGTSIQNDIPITIFYDQDSSEDEYLKISLGDIISVIPPSSFMVSNPEHHLTIVDFIQSVSSRVHFNNGASSVDENDGTHSVEVMYKPAVEGIEPPGDVEVVYKVTDITTDNNDYQLDVPGDNLDGTGTIIFTGSGSSSEMIEFTIENDFEYEGDEDFQIELISATNADIEEPKVHTVTIVDDEEGSLDINITNPNSASTWITGQDEDIHWTENVIGYPNVTHYNIYYREVDGSVPPYDWFDVGANIPPMTGDKYYPWIIPEVDNPGNNFQVRVDAMGDNNPIPLASGFSEEFIIDILPLIHFAYNSSDVTETDANASHFVGVTIDIPEDFVVSPGSTASVNYEVVPSSALLNSDYYIESATGQIDFNLENPASFMLEITIIGDTESELDKDFSIQLSNPVNAVLPSNANDRIHTVNILDDDEKPDTYRHGEYISQEFNIADSNTGVILSDITGFTAQTGIYLGDDITDDPSKYNIDFFIKLMDADGVNLLPNADDFFEVDDEGNIDLSGIDISLVEKIQFKIGMETLDYEDFMPWVESISLDYTVEIPDELPDFSIELTDDSRTINPGDSIIFDINITKDTGFNQVINFTSDIFTDTSFESIIDVTNSAFDPTDGVAGLDVGVMVLNIKVLDEIDSAYLELEHEITITGVSEDGLLTHNVIGYITITEEDIDYYTLNITAPLEGGVSDDMLQPEFTLRLYLSTETDAENYTLEESAILADAFDDETSTTTLSLGLTFEQVVDGTTYSPYLRTNRHLWAEANDTITFDASTLSYDVIFPELIAGDINTDNLINSIDFTRATQDFYKAIENLLPDFNNDGDVTTTDLGYIFGSWFVEGELPYEE